MVNSIEINNEVAHPIPFGHNRDNWIGFTFIRHFQHGDVRTCEEAVAARGIKLQQELKSIVFKTETGFAAVHLRADLKVSSKKIKKYLKSKYLRFANSKELAEFGLELGLVNPGNTRFCEAHLICRSVFSETFVATNFGVFDEGVAFSPDDLLSLPCSHVGGFSYV